jgi:hypothetical protein
MAHVVMMKDLETRGRDIEKRPPRRLRFIQQTH